MSRIESTPLAAVAEHRGVPPTKAARVTSEATPLPASLSERAEAALRHSDRAARLAHAADLGEDLARHEPAAFEFLSARLLRWPTEFVNTVVADLSEVLREPTGQSADDSTPVRRSLHFLESWVEAARCAYIDKDGTPQDAERARMALRDLRAQAVGPTALTHVARRRAWKDERDAA